ncbi:MAG: valine--pyruvate transaminase [Spirochaetales bacterium]|nr:valine--pyruvate transaminase [Spirochaetales bacterium]
MYKSEFAEKFTRKSGILELMDDLGTAMSANGQFYMLGGGNPAHIPEINDIWRRRMEEILADGDAFEKMLVNYDTPQGKTSFLEALAGLLNREFGWSLGPENIGITNGSQTSFFLLFNMLTENRPGKPRKRVLFPLMPEYIGYADQSRDEAAFTACKPRIEEYPDRTFKYFIDFDNIQLDESISAVCVSRPTNPTGNVLTNEEILRLSDLTEAAGIPLIIDNAYGLPFPGIIFEDVSPFWEKHVILNMSLSKLGLPGTRTGMVIADEKTIKDLSAINAILSLSNGSIGQVIVEPLLRSGQILEISRNIIRPYYRQKSNATQQLVRDFFGNSFPWAMHKSEGALFLWLWFKDLATDSRKLYTRLKDEHVLVIPGEYFFFGLEQPWKHANECIRITYSQNEDEVSRGLEIIARTVRSMY